MASSGGTVGAILTGVFADKASGQALKSAEHDEAVLNVLCGELTHHGASAG